MGVQTAVAEVALAERCIEIAMKFLVILICLAMNILWLKDFNRFDDSWFFRLYRTVNQAFSSAEEGSWLRDFAPILIIYSMPLLLLALLLTILKGAVFSLPLMLLHVLVLLFALDRTQPGSMAQEFLKRWREGDNEACLNYLSIEFRLSPEQKLKDEAAICAFFRERLIYQCFEKMFVMLFWYLVAGPLGVLICYISYQLRDSVNEHQTISENKIVINSLRVLKWVPLRLLSITFALAGNFVNCFDLLKQSFWSMDEAGASSHLVSYANSALAYDQGLVSEGKVGTQTWRIAQETQIEKVRALLERSQIIWLTVLALITLISPLWLVWNG